MVVRIKLPQGRPISHKPGKNRHVAFAIGALLTPAALMAWVLGFWRLAADMGVAGEFGITGVLSHWQIWMIFGAVLQGGAAVLNRYGRGGELQGPRVLMFYLFPASRIDRTESDKTESVKSEGTGNRQHAISIDSRR